MTIQCFQVLKIIKKFTNNTNSVFGVTDCALYWSGKGLSDCIPNKFSGELSTIICVLVDEGYLVKAGIGYHLTHKGLHPHQYLFIGFKDFFFRSILTPIIVSFATTLLTLLVALLLK
jgi:hypothetical protein